MKIKRISKTLLSMLAAVVLAAAMVAPAFADTVSSKDWNVTFTQSKEMKSNFDSKSIATLVNNIQPGDTADISITLINQNSSTTDWYMTNKIIQSLEDTKAEAQGGAYTYRLVYTGPTGTANTLFDSDTVGGDASAGGQSGLHEATGAMKDYFMLGTLAPSQSGVLSLQVTLDGETQGNDYQETLADLSMDFAVEIAGTGGSNTPTSTLDIPVPRTGDTVGFGIMVLAIVGACAGLLLLILAILGHRRRKQDEEEAQQHE